MDTKPGLNPIEILKPAMDAKRVKAVGDVYSMHAWKVQNPVQTRSYLIELEKRRRTGVKFKSIDIVDQGLIPIISSFIVEETKSKVTDFFDKDYVEFKNAILKYIDRMMPTTEAEKESRGPAKMNMDSVQNTWTDDYGTVWTPNSLPA